MNKTTRLFNDLLEDMGISVKNGQILVGKKKAKKVRVKVAKTQKAPKEPKDELAYV